MKKLLACVLISYAGLSAADSFQDFNNNLYASYSLVSPSYNGAVNIDQWGIGGTAQTKSDIWFSADASMGQYRNNASSNTGGNIALKAGYAFQFFKNDSTGFQLIPFASFSTQQGAVAVDGSGVATAVDGNIYNYGLGVQPELRVGPVKFALGLGLTGNQIGVNGQNQQNFNYSISPEVQYDIAKMVMLSVGYNYTNAFNSSQAFSGVGGTNTVTAKVGYLF